MDGKKGKLHVREKIHEESNQYSIQSQGQDAKSKEQLQNMFQDKTCIICHQE